MSTSIRVSFPHSRWRGERRDSSARRALRWLGRWTLVFGSLVAALAFGLATWIHDAASVSSVSRWLFCAAYALTVCFGLALLRPNARPGRTAAVAVALCLGVEALQLWHGHALEVARATWIGHLVLGSGFAWLDCAAYAAGGAVGALWLRLLPFRRRPPEREPAIDFVRPMGVRP